jgi:hypothetical protein
MAHAPAASESAKLQKTSASLIGPASTTDASKLPLSLAIESMRLSPRPAVAANSDGPVADPPPRLAASLPDAPMDDPPHATNAQAVKMQAVRAGCFCSYIAESGARPLPDHGQPMRPPSRRTGRPACSRRTSVERARCVSRIALWFPAISVSSHRSPNPLDVITTGEPERGIPSERQRG